MYKKQECVAMLLAGGQGSRLYTLTEKTAKPAVRFGGKYRIIDFPLSNCVNSGIYTVGVLTQYQPLQLNEYIGNGQPWDLDRGQSGVMVLPPYQAKSGADWYKGTANAIYQNFNFIDRYDPDYVLILSGDHIYKMDYAKMLAAHKEKGADCTIAVLEVTLEEASRFGIMNTDEDLRITEFEEKPKHPKSTKASMGIYIFNNALLRRYLEEDEADPASSKDFGKNVIPKMLADGCKMYAYPFHGYWKDVGTIQSLWEANMDLVGEQPVFDLRDRDWRIYSRNYSDSPHFVGEYAKISNSLITEGCTIEGIVENSVLSSGVKVCRGAYIKDSIIMSGVTVGEGATVNYSIVDDGAVIGAGSTVGRTKASGEKITVIGSGISLKPATDVPGGEMVDEEWLKSQED
ncbi:MAG: glucose-1-phosphate adenylyltransferase [Clostridiales bacterium]|nr:glucose-1-phosphate adenylyltransferase [Clostridia bacterium]MCR5683400.1 glucose-1-phosphate adenylyltransferase [Clostridiales bacterium]